MHFSRIAALATALLLFVVVAPVWSAPFDEAFPDARVETSDDDAEDDADSIPPKELARDENSAEVAADELRSIDQYQTAREASAAGDLQRCEQALRTLYAQRPNLPPHKLMLVRMLIEERQLRAARTVLENAAGAHLDHPELYLLFAKLAVADGRFTDAGLHLKEARALPQPKNWTPEQIRRFDLQCLAGETLVAEQHRDWDKAIGLYQRSIDADPQNAALRLRSAIALYRAGQLEAAYEQFDVAYRHDAEFHPPELALALLLVRDEKYRPAEAWFQKAIERYPREPRVFSSAASPCSVKIGRKRPTRWRQRQRRWGWRHANCSCIAEILPRTSANSSAPKISIGPR